MIFPKTYRAKNSVSRGKPTGKCVIRYYYPTFNVFECADTHAFIYHCGKRFPFCVIVCETYRTTSAVHNGLCATSLQIVLKSPEKKKYQATARTAGYMM